MFAQLTRLHADVTCGQKKNVELYYFHIAIYIVAAKKFYAILSILSNTSISTNPLIATFIRTHCVCLQCISYTVVLAFVQRYKWPVQKVIVSEFVCNKFAMSLAF